MIGAGRDRGQLVLVAAAVVAVALIPVVLAYAQLGYAGVATTDPSASTPTSDAVRALDRAAFAASEGRQGRSGWDNRTTVAATVAGDFDDRAARIETRDLAGARVHRVDRNASAATAWAATECPSGADRQFGPCVAIDGVVVQERADDVHVLAIAVDVETVAERATYEGTYVLDAALGDGRAAQLGDGRASQAGP